MTSSASRFSLALLLLAAPAASSPSLLRSLELQPFTEPVVMPVDFGETGFRDYAALGARLEAAGADFPAVFREACALAERRGGSAQEVKTMLAGLVTWLGDRERPRAICLQGRLDWAFHFTYGAWLESIGYGLGERAAYRKENRDAFAEGNGYDLGDLAITLTGVRWLREESARRLAEWGNGAKRLEDLRPCLLPKLPHGVVATAAQTSAAAAYAATALP